MKNVYRISGGPLFSNSYILTENNSDCIVVDCCDGDKILRFLHDNGLKCRAVFLTHAHFDHCMNVSELAKEGAEIYMHEADIPLIHSSDNLAETMGADFKPFDVDVKVADGDIYSLCSMTVKVIHTPGHTRGGVCYLVDDEIIFSGDTLFRMSVGRTDFPGGNARELAGSVKEKLFTLQKNYSVYPGHDEATNIFFERENNRYV